MFSVDEIVDGKREDDRWTPPVRINKCELCISNKSDMCSIHDWDSEKMSQFGEFCTAFLDDYTQYTLPDQLI